MINVLLLLIIEVVLVIGSPISPSLKFILSQTVILGGFIHLLVIVHHPLWCHNSV